MTRARMLLLFVVSLAVLVGGGAIYALTQPAILCRVAERALDWPEDSIQVETLDFSWPRRVRLANVRVDPPEERMPAVNIEWVEADLPSPLRAWWSKEVHLGVVEASGVDVGLRVQRPPQVAHVPEGQPLTLTASSLTLEDSRFTAAPDPPFNEVLLVGLDGELDDVRWTPSLKRIEGVGRARSDIFNLGTIGLTNLDLPVLILADEDLVLEEATFDYGRTEGTANGVIRNLPGQPEVEITVAISSSRVEEAVEDAIGRVSPVTGWLRAELTVRAGGELERGDSRLDGWVSLTEGFVFMGTDVKLIPRLLLDVAPWFQRDNGGWISVGDLRGEARFGRGWVELDRLERVSKKHRVLQAWGDLRDGQVDLTVRVVPKRKPDNAGIGVRVRGPLRSTKVKLAKKSELMEAPEIMILQ
ncbi:MAG: hypothetical protein KC912_26590 [Proteobacteria bacterium]|nr:hypothetical protein [Pseudomonadota bacterium]